MSKKVTVELSDALIHAVEQMAAAAGVSPGEFIAEQVAHQLAATGTNGNALTQPSADSVQPDIQQILQRIATEKNISLDQLLVQWKTQYGSTTRKSIMDPERKARLDQLRRYSGAVNSGASDSADNQRIDAELAAEYANSHGMDR